MVRNGFPFQGAAEEHVLARIGKAYSRNDRSALWADVDQPFRLETIQRFGDGEARHPEPPSQFRLLQFGPRFEFKIYDRMTKLLDDALRRSGNPQHANRRRAGSQLSFFSCAHTDMLVG